jgi:hypothetical protein
MMSEVDFDLKNGDKVEHCKDPGIEGIVVGIDLDSYPYIAYGVTTCSVIWSDDPNLVDIQWTNKLIKIEES